MFGVHQVNLVGSLLSAGRPIQLFELLIIAGSE